MKEQIVLVGGGGHCKVVIDAIKNANAFNIYGITDAHLPKGASILGVDVLGNDDVLQQVYDEGIKYAFITVGSIGDCTIRKKIAGRLEKIGFKLPPVIHPKAVVGEDVETGDGTFVAAGAVINPGTKIGKNAIINTSSSIDHDCEIGDFVHIAPGVTLSGGVKVSDEVHIGTGANVIQGLKIEDMVSAGLTATKDVRKGQPLKRPATLPHEIQP